MAGHFVPQRPVIFNRNPRSLSAVTHNQLTYGYDALDRLVSSTRGQRQTRYQYDAVGNRLDVSSLFGEHRGKADRDDDARGLQAQYDAANQLTAIVGPDGRPLVSYTYDGNGNPLSRGGFGDPVTYTWDGANRLSSVSSGNDQKTSYAYDGDGHMYQEQTSNNDGDDSHGRTLRYTLDQAGPLSQILSASDGRHSANYLYGLGRIAGTSDKDTVYYETDVRGSVRTLADGRGRLRGTRAYDPFGVPLHSGEGDDGEGFFAHLDNEGHEASRGGLAGLFGYTGERQDPTRGLINLRARWYQPPTARFLGRDTFPGALGDPLSQHPYLYARANPTSFVDPSGHFQQFIRDHVQGAEFYGQSLPDALNAFAQGLVLEAAYDNYWMAPGLQENVAPRPGESAAQTLGRLAGDTAVLAQSGGQIIKGGSLVGGSAALCLATEGAGCVAVAPALAAGGALVLDGAGAGTAAAVAWNQNYGTWRAQTGATNAGNSGGPANVGPGQWVPVSRGGGSPAASQYQERVTGAPADREYLVNGVYFDGYDAFSNTLIDAKGPSYARLLDPRNADWSTAPAKLSNEASRQVQAANGIRVVWYVQEEQAVSLIQSVLEESGIEGITVMYKP